MKAPQGLFLFAITVATLAINNAYATNCSSPAWAAAHPAECRPPTTSTASSNAAAAAVGSGQATLKGNVEGTNTLKNSGNSESTSYSQGGQGGQGGKGGTAHATGGNAKLENAGNSRSTSQVEMGPVSATGGKSSSHVENVGNSPSSAKAVTGSSTATTGNNENELTVDASSRDTNINTSSNKSLTVTLPTVVPPLPPMFSPSGDTKQVVMPCGPLQGVQTKNVNGVFMGLIGSPTTFELGENDRLVPYRNERGEFQPYLEQSQGDGSVRLFGHQLIITTAVSSVAGARQLALGGFNGSGGGQMGGGGNGAMTRLVTNVLIALCQFEHRLPPPPAPVVITPPPVVVTPPPVQPEPPKAKKKGGSKGKNPDTFVLEKPCKCE